VDQPKYNLKGNLLTVQVTFSVADLIALENGTYVGDPIRKAIEASAEAENRRIKWNTRQVRTVNDPTGAGLIARVSVLTTKKENDDD
jgi:hypothetical protein